MNINIRVSLAFANKSDDNIIVFAGTVLDKLYSIASFPTPPVPAASLEAAIDAFQAAKWSQVNGGKMATATKNALRTDLTGKLRALALYVQFTSANDLAMLLSSGFETTNMNRTRYPLAKPTILRIANSVSGQSVVTLSSEPVARGSEVRLAEAAEDGTLGEFRPAVFNTNSRKNTLGDLIPGKLYAYQGRLMGGSMMHSEWSDLVIQRAI
jgi:hypothetical protein